MLFTSFSSHPYVDPTGTYTLDGKTQKKGDDIYGYFGEILVKKLSDQKILMAFDICKGAPSYNSGSFLDTLDYTGAVAIYKADPDLDPTCQIKFEFTSKGITVSEETEELGFGCGFGYSVIADGFFKKISSAEPDIKDKF